MKFQLNALAAALALAVVAVPAQAAIDATASGNGSLILTVIDKVTNVSAFFDLGKNYSDFNQVAAAGAVSTVTASGTSFSWDLSSNADYLATWNSFLGASTLANTQWAITAGDNLGAGAGSRGYVSTFVSPGATGTGTTSSSVITAVGNFDTFTSNAAVGAGSTMLSAANGAAYLPVATPYYGSGKNNGTGPVVMGAIGTSLGVVQQVVGASSFVASTQTVFGNGAQFTLASNGALSYTTNPIVTPPVPEADTWAMMMVGLGLMGFMARRRNRNQA